MTYIDKIHIDKFTNIGLQQTHFYVKAHPVFHCCCSVKRYCVLSASCELNLLLLQMLPEV